MEGGSVLVHAAKKENEGTAPMILPSFLYGTLALPLGIIGASPGPSVIASLPHAPSLKALESLHSETTNDDQPTNNMQEPHSSKTLVGAQTPNGDEGKEQIAPLISRSEMIRKVREDNRRSLVRKQHPPAPPTRPKQHTTPAKLLSGLDGRPLSTPLAEGMRRVRFLSMGAALVMTVISYESRQQEAKQESTLLRRRGRDANAIQSLVEHASNENGVAIRLVRHHEMLKGVLSRSNGVVVPLLYPADKIDLPTMNDTPTYWNLGNTLQEWRQMPLTRDWLFHSSDETSSLVLEADVSSLGLLSEYFSPQQEEKPLAGAMWVSTILGIVARQKGVLPPHETKEALINVMIGSGERRVKEEENTNVIYINGPLAVGVKVASLFGRIQQSGHDVVMSAQSRKADALVEDTTALVEQPPLRFPFALFEFVGAKLRQGASRAVTAVTMLLTRDNNKTVHVVSDHCCVAQWLRRTLPPTEWNVSWYNAHSGIANYRNAIAKKEGVTFVCCQNDKATCSVICSLLTEDQAPSRIVVLVEEESCASMLTMLAAELDKDAHVEILSIKSIHASLFDRVRNLLAKGKTQSQVKELIYLME